jgi:fructosamine-3-kinase
VQLPDGTAKQFFLKTSSGSGGRAIVEGEYHAMTALYNTAPDFAPKPYTWGTFRQGAPETHFFICDFIRMSDDMPDPAQFCSQLAELHKNSVSPTGKFGFHISTCHGQFKQALEWDGNWASFFAKLLKEVLVFDESVNGVWPAFHTVAERTLSHVIPRLLGVLQKDGRYLRPSLIHGDLWEGNVATDSETGQIYVFDAGAYYAHHEMELGMWRCNRHKICRNEEYKRQYLEHMAISEPVEEFDDRNRLYCVKVNVLHSAHHPGTIDRVT